VPDSESLEPSAYLAVQLMAFHMYDAASKDAQEKDPPPVQQPLSRRERQCLELAAQGKSDWVSSRILGLSERGEREATFAGGYAHAGSHARARRSTDFSW
jgi:hypothetical protein